jgi:hypothetical protein
LASCQDASVVQRRADEGRVGPCFGGGVELESNSGPVVHLTRRIAF